MCHIACVVAQVGFQACLHRQDALGCHGFPCLPLHVCEVEKNKCKCSGHRHQIVQSSAYPAAWHRAPLERFFCMCMLNMYAFGSGAVRIP